MVMHVNCHTRKGREVPARQLPVHALRALKRTFKSYSWEDGVLWQTSSCINKVPVLSCVALHYILKVEFIGIPPRRTNSSQVLGFCFHRQKIGYYTSYASVSEGIIGCCTAYPALERKKKLHKPALLFIWMAASFSTCLFLL